jgi:lipoprotein-anchoring transpeptidase ErfK/SrfK
MPRPAPARTVLLVLATCAALLLSGCGGSGSPAKAGAKTGGKGGSSSSSGPDSFSGDVGFNVRDGAKAVTVSRKIKVTAQGAELQSVTVEGPGGNVPGQLSSDSATWRANGLLRPAATYKITALAVDDNGVRQTFNRSFTTRKLSLDEQTYPSFVPAPGSTVGIAMPVIIRFDVPVTNKASIQKHLAVTSVPAQPGAWHWISDNEVHWRPQTYWKAGTKVTVAANIGGVPAGGGIYGQLDRQETFNIGRAQVLKVNTRTDQLKVLRAGKLVKQIPITTGAQPEFTTRSGVKVIIEKDRRHDMNSETIGIDPNGPNGYNLKGVEFAMRLTYSGEFLHAAPWSVGSQGRENVSHGCTGMSTANADWLYNNTLVGDPVEYTGTNRMMTLTNGYGDWNVSFDEYQKGSAL